MRTLPSPASGDVSRCPLAANFDSGSQQTFGLAVLLPVRLWKRHTLERKMVKVRGDSESRRRNPSNLCSRLPIQNANKHEYDARELLVAEWAEPW